MNTDDLEKRLFMILDTLEQQQEQFKNQIDELTSHTAELTAQEIEKALREIQPQTEKQLKAVNELIEVAKLENKNNTTNTTNTNHLQIMLKEQIDELQRLQRKFVNTADETIKSATIEVLTEHMGENVAEYDRQYKASADHLLKSAKTATAVYDKEYKQSSDELLKSAKSATMALKETENYYQEWFAWKVMALWGGAILLFLIIMIGLVLFFFPSLQDIKDRRAELKTVQHEIDRRGVTISNCAGKSCVRVDTSKCNYGVSKWNNNVQFCVIK